MTEQRVLNQLRERSMLISRSFKAVFAPDGGGRRFGWIVRLLWPIGWRERAYARAFGDPVATGLGLEANHVLADLRGFCFAEKTSFDPDPHIAARREGRREVWLRIQRYLNLDEGAVRKLMEIDDE